jgi:hypothetical protein
MLFGEAYYKAYNTKQAVVNYNIFGEGKMTETTNINIIGSASLIFVDWGAKRIYKENYIKTSTGVIKDNKDVQNLILEDYGTIYEVNFNKEVINKREDHIIKEAIKEKKDVSNKSVEGWKNIGTSNVLGYSCEEFVDGNKKRCIYKGITIKEELQLDDVLMVKEAVSIEFEEDITDEYFELPTFKKSKSKGFLATNLSTSKPIIQDKCILPQISKELFNRQKELLPQLLREIQEARVCLENAEDRIEANLCLDRVVKIKSEINGLEDNGCEITMWKDGQKEEKLQSIEYKILKLKQQMPCIRRSRNIDDLSKCMEEKMESVEE